MLFCYCVLFCVDVGVLVVLCVGRSSWKLMRCIQSLSVVNASHSLSQIPNLGRVVGGGGGGGRLRRFLCPWLVFVAWMREDEGSLMNNLI